MFNYTDILLKKHVELDEAYYNMLLETAEAEVNFLMSCLESGIILEAEGDATSSNNGEKKVGWFRKLIEVVKALFAKFVNKNNDMIAENEKWLNDNLDMIQKMSYDGLKASVVVMDTKNMGVLDQMIQSTSRMLEPNISKNDLEKLKTKEDVEQYKEFGKILIKDKTFAESVKIKMLGGTDKEPEPVILEGQSLKKYCTTSVVNYVKGYKAIVSSYKKYINALETRVKNLENELKKRGETLESYSVIENCLFKDSGLRYCCNFDVLYEANNDDKESTVTKDEDMKVNQVVNTHTEGSSTDYVKYMRWAVQLNQVVITTALTIVEMHYINSVKLLKNVISANA